MSNMSIEEFDRAFAKLRGDGDPPDAAFMTVEEAFDAYFSKDTTEAQREIAAKIVADEGRARSECDALIGELTQLNRSRRGLSEAEAEVRAKSDVMTAIEEAPTLTEAVTALRRVRDQLVSEGRR